MSDFKAIMHQERERSLFAISLITSDITNSIKIDFGWGSAPDPAGGAYSVPQAP